jgi:fructokinase
VGALLGAIEIGGSKVLCALGSSHREVLAELRIDTRDPESTLRDVEAFFAPHAHAMRGLGIASFGPLELDRHRAGWGAMLSTPKPGWSGAQVAGRLARSLGVPVELDTDVNAACLAEQTWGAAEGAESSVYITVGTGLGVGVVIHGKPLHGLMHPELGHAPAAGWCNFIGACPFHGRCLEGVASGHALRLRTGRQPAELDDEDPVWDVEAAYLGQLVVLTVLAYSPHRVVLGGGVLERAGLLERVRAAVPKQLAGYVPRAELSLDGMQDFLVAPSLGQRAGLAGAFLLAAGRSA